MAQYLRELCHLLLEHHAGELSAQIFATLCAHGRLTVYALATNAKAPLRRVKHCLAAMIERQLVMYYTAHADAPTYYAVNLRGVYNLARGDNIVTLVTDRYGDGAGRIVNNIQHLGLTRLGDLAKAYTLDTSSKRDSGAEMPDAHTGENGMRNGNTGPATHSPADISSVGFFHATVRTLLQSGILVKVSTRAFMPPPDLQDEIEETVIGEKFPDRKITGPKKQSEFKDAVVELKRRWRADDEYSDHNDLGSKAAFRRPGQILDPPSKRIKVSHDQANGVTHEADESFVDTGMRLSNDLIVRVDFARCALALRSRRLEHMAGRYLGPGTAAVYRALLIALESKMKSMRAESLMDTVESAETALPTVTLATIAEYLEPSADLWSTITGMTGGGKTNKAASKGSKRARLVEEDDFSEIGIKREHHSESEDDETTTNGFTSYRERAKRLSLIEAHLCLLEEHFMHFASRVGKHGDSNEWRVNFPALTKTMIEAELDATVLARSGQVAQRVMRMLREHGHLEEKQMARYAMVHVKDLEHVLTHLQTNGLLEPQEIPRDNTRLPQKCFYLWNCDSTRSQQLLIQQTYKAMARTMQRLKVERERYKQVIKKAERSDVQGHENEKLETNDKIALREWRDAEERMMTQVSRMDDVIALLRDFSATDTSLTL